MAKTYIYTKSKNKNPLQKHKIKIKNMHNNNRCVLKKEFLWAKRHNVNGTAHDENPLHLHPRFGEPYCARKTCIEGASPHYDKNTIKKEPGQLVQSIKKCGRMFPLKKQNKKSAHMTLTYGQGKVTSQNWKLLLQHLSLHTNTLGEGFALKYTHKMFEWRAIGEI